MVSNGAAFVVDTSQAEEADSVSGNGRMKLTADGKAVV
jgi:hypothetical protein